MSRDSLIDRHTYLSGELAAILREHGDLRAEIVKAWTAAWRNFDHIERVTEREGMCKEATNVLEAEATKLSGDIAAYRVELNNIETILRYSDAIAPS